MRVGIDTSAVDGTFLDHAQRGIGRYASEMKRFFSEHAGDSGVEVGFFDRGSVNSIQSVDRAINLLPAGRATVRSQLVYPLLLRGRRVQSFDYLHFLAQTDAPWRCPKPFIVTAHDLIPHLFRDLYRPKRMGWRFEIARFFELKAIARAARVLTISHSSAKDISRITGIAQDKIRVTPLGVDEKFFDAKLIESEIALRSRYRVPIERPIILYVGGIDERKNIRMMLNTLREIKQHCIGKGQLVPVLLIAGRIAQDKQYPAFANMVSELGLDGDVVTPGYVPDGDLQQIYAIARLFLFLSLYEGFGLSPVEALAAGCPVVSSNRSSMPEVLGSAAAMVNPENLSEITKAVLEILESPEMNSSVIERGREQARKFPWRQTGEKTLEVYREMAGIQQMISPARKVASR